MSQAIDQNVYTKFIDRLCDDRESIVFFPVRHHSPIAAFLLRRWIEENQPTAVLIEGPSDYNEHLDELKLKHKPPISIYSFFRTEHIQSGAFYPFCDYSPEWQALKQSFQQKTPVQFIDMPWSENFFLDAGDVTEQTHRYADQQLRYSQYIKLLCERLHVEDFDDLWDRMIESDWSITLKDYLRRVHELCLNIRLAEQSPSSSDLTREMYMAEQIRKTITGPNDKILVVTGGYHSASLLSLIQQNEDPFGFSKQAKAASRAALETEKVDLLQKGVCLTNYSFQRLDSHSGYNAGMPNPGFYQTAWEQLSSPKRRREPENQPQESLQDFDHRPLLQKLVKDLRKRKQTLSTADLIAIETSGLALANLRGRHHLWRNDLGDAVETALVKDESSYACPNPLIDAVNRVLCGNKVGELASGIRQPPLVHHIQETLTRLKIKVDRRPVELELNLLEANDLQRSRVFHQLNVLNISGFKLVEGTDFKQRNDLKDLYEVWRIGWSPEYESSCVEAARYGTTLSHAAGARLTEVVQGQKQNSNVAGRVLITAAQCGIKTLSIKLLKQISRINQTESKFENITSSLNDLLFLYCYDEIFGAVGEEKLTELISNTFSRSLWLLESLGKSGISTKDVLIGIDAIKETFKRLEKVLEVDLENFCEILTRVAKDSGKSQTVRGACSGILWEYGKESSDSVLQTMRLFHSPEHFGDFLEGLFSTAREIAQNHPPIVQSIDSIVDEYSAEEFQTALPSLRLAFSSFAPREKNRLLKTLFESLGLLKIAQNPLPTVSRENATEALFMEEKCFEIIAKYRLEAFDETI